MNIFAKYLALARERFQPKRLLILFSVGAIIFVLLTRLPWKIGVNLSDSIDCHLFIYTQNNPSDIEFSQLILFHPHAEDHPEEISALIAGKPLVKEASCFAGDYLVCNGAGCECNGSPAGLPVTDDQRHLSFFWSGVVPPGCVFATGNKNPRSFDSRFWGFLSVERIEGKVIKCLF